MRPITLTFLKSLDACQAQVDLFAQTYGESVTPTLELIEAAAQLFDFDWLGGKVFGEAYREAMAPHRQAYREAKALHLKAYEEAMAIHEKAYLEAVAPHGKAYLEAMAPLTQALNLAQARVFAILWSQQ